MRPAVIWLTGLSGAGKTAVAEQLSAALERKGVAVTHLDGDVLRRQRPGLGYSREDRDRHIRDTGRMASALEKEGRTVVVSLISPYEESRNFARRICENFIEVYVSTPLAACEKRDPKGLYAKARRGEIRHFTGIDDPYEPPGGAEVEIDTESMSIEDSVECILETIFAKCGVFSGNEFINPA